MALLDLFKLPKLPPFSQQGMIDALKRQRMQGTGQFQGPLPQTATQTQTNAFLQAAIAQPQVSNMPSAPKYPGLERAQFNFKMPDGTVIPAGINPGQAATID